MKKLIFFANIQAQRLEFALILKCATLLIISHTTSQTSFYEKKFFVFRKIRIEALQ